MKLIYVSIILFIVAGLGVGWYAYIRTQSKQAIPLPYSVPSPLVSSFPPSPSEPRINSSPTLLGEHADPRLLGLNVYYKGAIYNDKSITRLQNEAIAWHLTEQELKEWVKKSPGYWDMWKTETTFITNIMVSAPLVENGIKKEYLFLQTTDNACQAHPCVAVIGMAVLAQKNGQWEVETLEKFISQGGTFGNIPKPPIIINIGTNHPAFLLRDYTTYQGYTSGSIRIFAYASGAFHEVLHINDAFADNKTSMGAQGGGESIYSYDTTVNVLPSSKDFFDLNVVKSGTEGYLANGVKDLRNIKETRDVHEVFVYTFVGEKYTTNSK